MGNTPQRAARLYFRAPGFARQNEARSRSLEHRQARAFGGRESVALAISGCISGCISGGKRRDLTGNFAGRERSNIPRRFTDQTSRRHFSRAGNRRSCGSAIPISKPGGNRRNHSGHGGQFDRHAAAILGCLASQASLFATQH